MSMAQREQTGKQMGAERQAGGRRMRGWSWQGTAGMALLLCGCAPGQPGTYLQSGTGTTSSSNSSNRGVVYSGAGNPASDDFSFDPNMSHRQMVSRREDLKRRMTENAARLLTLTHDLQAELEHREPTEADGKRLDEIAKLARTVRDQMRQ